MSKHSPCPVGNDEVLAMFVFKPIQIDRKGKLKPGLFDHVHEKGRSIQRDTIATKAELLKFVTRMLGSRDDFIWKGLLLAQCHTVRNIEIENSTKRSVCVYDTAEKENPAHGEICQTHYVIDEADKIELRHELWSAFNSGNIVSPMQYRNGVIWNGLPGNFQSRG